MPKDWPNVPEQRGLVAGEPEAGTKAFFEVYHVYRVDLEIATFDLDVT